MNVASANATGCYTHQYLARPCLWLGQISNFQVFVFREQQGLHVKIRCQFAQQRDLLSAWLLPCPSSDCCISPGKMDSSVRLNERRPKPREVTGTIVQRLARHDPRILRPIMDQRQLDILRLARVVAPKRL